MGAHHKCPVRGCQSAVANNRLMCPTHWWLVPKTLQNAVYHWYRQAPRSQQHFDAMNAAVEAVNDALAGQLKSS